LTAIDTAHCRVLPFPALFRALRLPEVNSMSYNLIVNGQPITVDVPAETPLLWVIRDILDLKGTKYGCGMALCGCCTVHINGEATRSCTTAISAAADKHVTTLEGLSEDGTHPVQLAWEEMDGRSRSRGPDCVRQGVRRLSWLRHCPNWIHGRNQMARDR